MEFTFLHVIFLAVAGFTLLCGLGVVVSRNLFHSAIWLIGAFAGVAAIYWLLEAEYLAIAQIKGTQLKEARESLAPLLAKAPNDITYNLAQIQLDMDSNRLADAQQRIDRMRTLYPGNYPLNQARVDLLLKQNRPADAEKALEALLKSRPDDPDVWYLVAETRGLSGNIIGLHQARAEYFALMGDYRQAIQQIAFAKKLTNNFQLSSRLDARQRELMDQERAIKDMMN